MDRDVDADVEGTLTQQATQDGIWEVPGVGGVPRRVWADVQWEVCLALLSTFQRFEPQLKAVEA